MPSKSVSKKVDKAAVKAARQRMLASLQLKAISLEDANVLHTAFSVLDQDEDGFLSLLETYTWFRACGWALSDEKLDDALRLGTLHDKKKFTITELLRAADANYSWRFDLDRDEDMVRETFETLDSESHGSLMRADLHKYLQGNFSQVECNQLLEMIGYPNNVLTFTTQDLTKRTTTQLDEPRTEGFLQEFAGIF